MNGISQVFQDLPAPSNGPGRRAASVSTVTPVSDGICKLIKDIAERHRFDFRSARQEPPGKSRVEHCSAKAKGKDVQRGCEVGLGVNDRN